MAIVFFFKQGRCEVVLYKNELSDFFNFKTLDDVEELEAFIMKTEIAGHTWQFGQHWWRQEEFICQVDEWHFIGIHSLFTDAAQPAE